MNEPIMRRLNNSLKRPTAIPLIKESIEIPWKDCKESLKGIYTYSFEGVFIYIPFFEGVFKYS